jgi:hypothetical protein
MATKQILRKFLHKTVHDNLEVITNERIEQEVLTQDELDCIVEMFGDGDDAYMSYGLAIDFNEELCVISLDKLACGLEDYITQNDPEDTVDIVAIQKKIEPWRAYDLDFETMIEPERLRGSCGTEMDGDG